MMKRIVAYVSPLQPDDRLESFRSQADEVVAKTDSSNILELNTEKDGTVRFEAVLSDKRINQIVDALLQANEMQNEAESLVSELMRAQFRDSPESSQGVFHRILSDVEKELLNQAFEECNHVKTKTAAKLGIDRNTLHKKLQRHGLIECDDA